MTRPDPDAPPPSRRAPIPADPQLWDFDRAMSAAIEHTRSHMGLPHRGDVAAIAAGFGMPADLVATRIHDGYQDWRRSPEVRAYARAHRKATAEIEAMSDEEVDELVDLALEDSLSE